MNIPIVSILILLFSCGHCLPLGGGIITAISGNNQSGDEVVYETQNVYGTISGKQRQIAVRQGLRPVVDTLEEHEKYGNDGGIQRQVAKVIVNKSEGLEAALTNAFEFPRTQTRAKLRSLTGALNRVGHSLVGL